MDGAQHDEVSNQPYFQARRQEVYDADNTKYDSS